VILYDRIDRIKHLTRILRSSHPIKLGNLLDLRIRIERVNSIELKFNLTITLICYASTFVRDIRESYAIEEICRRL
jgi:hypothetical protein